ncbi:ImmA/IrrE family metallo-endopeptidase [Romboutsia hominis]|uniref:IrrE N-terminal-like domain-containing protein n=1 Tax=Romboutsia hominis TaxID=1507512 RepID=A0A2P2BQB5_9FIRM|nr:ImmA/IrrE family metallo-endopeptidase [Romboutsia hominis]CEI72517.1 Domain of unknown function (DUF955) [Romboutsia hominis]
MRKYINDKKPEIYAEEIIQALNLEPPIDLEKICEYYDVNVNNEPLKNVEAILIISKGKKNILINESKYIYNERKRFTIAHEIGHLFIPWHDNISGCTGIGNFNSEDNVENEADLFASALLIPKNDIIKDIEGKSVTLSLIEELARKYQVSLGAMTRRILKYTDDNVVALFYFKNGKKIVQASSASFSSSLKSGKIKESAADKMITGKMYKSKVLQEHTYNTWFSDSKEGYMIVEESLYQSNFDRVFTLIRKYTFTDNNESILDF